MALFTAIGAGIGALASGALGMTAAAGAIAGAGIGMQAAGAYGQAKSAKQQAAYQKGVALTNAEIARQNAADVELRGRNAVFDQRRAVSRALSNQRAATAAAGLVVDQAGTTPQALVDDMVRAGEMDVLRLRNNIEREKRRALVQGAQYEAQAGQFELQRSSISPFRSAFLTAGQAGLNSTFADILSAPKA